MSPRAQLISVQNGAMPSDRSFRGLLWITSAGIGIRTRGGPRIGLILLRLAKVCSK